MSNRKPLDPLVPCPFCGSEDLELSNTHTPYFSVECQECGAEVHGECIGKHSATHFSYSTEPRGQLEANYYGLPINYAKAARSAVAAWNRRDPQA